MKRDLATATILTSALLAAALWSGASGSSVQARDNPSFEVDIQPIFNASCAVSSCHTAAASGKLVLTADQSLKNLVGIESFREPGKVRVRPGRAAESYLVVKLEGRQSVGRKMPPGDVSLSEAEIRTIRNWIDKGAVGD